MSKSAKRPAAPPARSVPAKSATATAPARGGTTPRSAAPAPRSASSRDPQSAVVKPRSIQPRAAGASSPSSSSTAKPRTVPPRGDVRSADVKPRSPQPRGSEQRSAEPQKSESRSSEPRRVAPRSVAPRPAADRKPDVAPQAAASEVVAQSITPEQPGVVQPGQRRTGGAQRTIEPTAGRSQFGAGAPARAPQGRTPRRSVPVGAAAPLAAAVPVAVAASVPPAPVAQPIASQAPVAAPVLVAAPPPGAPPQQAPERNRRPRRRRRSVVAAVLVGLLVLALAWPVGLMVWANGRIQHLDALSGAANTPGTTYLLAGSDARGSGGIDDETAGARTDTIMLLHRPRLGPASLISLPRDTLVEIPGHGPQKLNAAYSFGGAPLLVKTVEELTGITIDHYVEIGFGGLEGVVDAVGGVELCYDRSVNDELSGMVWEPGCHVVDGWNAIAFSRMRYSDPLGDIGRVARQRQLIGAVTSAVADPSLLWHPERQVRLINAGLTSLTVDDHTNILDFAGLAWAFRRATGPNGVTGTPPIADLDYRPGNIGSTVLLNPETSPQFWQDVLNGDLEPGVVG